MKIDDDLQTVIPRPTDSSVEVRQRAGDERRIRLESPIADRDADVIQSADALVHQHDEIKAENRFEEGGNSGRNGKYSPSTSDSPEIALSDERIPVPPQRCLSRSPILQLPERELVDNRIVTRRLEDARRDPGLQRTTGF